MRWCSYFTLRLCELPFTRDRARCRWCRSAPFLLMLNGGYLDDVHRRWRADHRQDGRRAHGWWRRRRPAGRSGCRSAPRWSAPARLHHLHRPGRHGIPHGAGPRPTAARCTTRSPTHASSTRDPSRRLPRHGRLLRLLSDRAGHGRLGRRAGRLPAGVVDAVADRRGRTDRRGVRRRHLGGDATPNGSSAASIPGRS